MRRGTRVDSRGGAPRVDRDVKAVHGDVVALLNAGLNDRAEDGEIIFRMNPSRSIFFAGGLVRYVATSDGLLVAIGHPIFR